MIVKSTRRQITIGMDEKVHANLSKMAKKSGMSLQVYSGFLFEAAYAARCGVQDDPVLSDAVSGTLALHGAGFDTTAVARTLRLTEALVDRITSAYREWRKQMPEGWAA
jgi:hypothetical protein